MAHSKKIHPHGAIRVNAYRIVNDAVERGAVRGVRRAFKHTPTPGQEQIAQEVEDAVMLELCEVVKFDDLPSNPYVVSEG